ncbi:biotin--[acetyl-CoA-carboxylase] ligase [candidate division TA06 bacterium]|nr:biotin--[acetyl-CoA-carboxylase] ligase [candidate division TA06 bacterium]
MNEILDAEVIQKGLTTSFLGKKIYAFGSLQSTQETAKRLAKNGAPEGSVVIAEQQTAGRGRFGRTWHSPKEGLWVSLILHPKIPSQKVPFLSLLTALSVTEAIRRTTSLLPTIKWPNDVLINGKKVCGILPDLETRENNSNLVIIGIGLNVNQSDFPLDLEETSTSLHLELDRPISKTLLLQELLLRFEENYIIFLKEETMELLEKIRGFSYFIGKRVTVDLKEKVLEGEVIDLDEEGRLVLRLDSGLIQRVVAGEARLVR